MKGFAGVTDNDRFLVEEGRVAHLTNLQRKGRGKPLNREFEHPSEMSTSSFRVKPPPHQRIQARPESIDNSPENEFCKTSGIVDYIEIFLHSNC